MSWHRRDPAAPPPHRGGMRERLHEIIFEADTASGKAFDIVLLLAIVASVVVVMLDSVDSIRGRHGELLWGMEWGFTLLFTVEYALRLGTVRRPSRYALSFFGMVDLLSILPTYLSLLFPGVQALLVVRAIRLLRVFRILKLAHFLGEAQVLSTALRDSARKIVVFLEVVVVLVLILGSMMYLVESPESGFTSIPQSVYWSVVTLTTVGYGDIAPATVLGKLLASVVMLVGYGIIAVPTGIVTSELTRAQFRRRGRSPAPEPEPVSTQACPVCAAEGHDADARYCKRCGAGL